MQQFVFFLKNCETNINNILGHNIYVYFSVQRLFETFFTSLNIESILFEMCVSIRLNCRLLFSDHNRSCNGYKSQ
jgi:hypothetical protein